MHYPNIKNVFEWGPWRNSCNIALKKGTIFLLDCAGNNPDEACVYRIDNDWDPSMGDDFLCTLSMFQRAGAIQNPMWFDGHAWELGNAKSKIKLWILNTNVVTPAPIKPQSVVRDMSDWRAWAHNVPGECPCGIPRGRCDYH